MGASTDVVRKEMYTFQDRSGRSLTLRPEGTAPVVRAFVEHPRAWMVKMGYTAVRYRGLTRNALDFALMSIAYNFKRSFHLLGQPLTPAASQ